MVVRVTLLSQSWRPHAEQLRAWLEPLAASDVSELAVFEVQEHPFVQARIVRLTCEQRTQACSEHKVGSRVWRFGRSCWPSWRHRRLARQQVVRSRPSEWRESTRSVRQPRCSTPGSVWPRALVRSPLGSCLGAFDAESEFRWLRRPAPFLGQQWRSQRRSSISVRHRGDEPAFSWQRARERASRSVSTAVLADPAHCCERRRGLAESGAPPFGRTAW